MAQELADSFATPPLNPLIQISLPPSFTEADTYRLRILWDLSFSIFSLTQAFHE